MKKLYSIFAFTFCSMLSIAQVSSARVYINQNNIQAMINVNGTLFTDLANGVASFESPIGMGNTTIYGSRLAFGGVSSNGNLSLSSSKENVEFNSGPLSVQNSNSSFGPGTIDSARAVYWDRTFQVNQGEINEFIAYRSCVDDPNCDENITHANYTIPSSILNWPAHGNPNFNEPSNLAPFYDANDDGVYEPNDGDFPCIKGDRYVWCVFNNHLVDGSLSDDHGGTEIQMGVYAYASSNVLNRTIFVEYKIINRSEITLDDFYIANITDIDIGFSGDDYFASLPSKNAAFGYNGDDFDEGLSFTMGYVDHPPMQGIVFLNEESFATGPINIYSDNGQEQYNLFKGLNKDGSTKVYPGTTVETKYTYPYLPTNPYEWNESSADENGSVNTPGERRLYMSAGPYDFTPGKVINLNMAFVISQGFNTTGALSGFTTLMDNIDSLQSFYDADIPNCSQYFLELEENKTVDFNIYPNPTSGAVNVEINNAEKHLIEAYNINGELLLSNSFQSKTVINLSEFENGVYFVKITQQNGSFEVLKLIKN